MNLTEDVANPIVEWIEDRWGTPSSSEDREAYRRAWIIEPPEYMNMPTNYVPEVYKNLSFERFVEWRHRYRAEANAMLENDELPEDFRDELEAIAHERPSKEVKKRYDELPVHAYFLEANKTAPGIEMIGQVSDEKDSKKFLEGAKKSGASVAIVS